ncbi:hypothetical protein NKJ72_29810, partial [Mesorhizobium sp. M0045]|uniref:hypothetical protein n=1 Tax=Mesorhizobium sp. M0045 TaxID=2956857 RepID=UPI00333C4F04
AEPDRGTHALAIPKSVKPKSVGDQRRAYNHSRVTVFVGMPRYFFDFTDTGKVFLDLWVPISRTSKLQSKRR